MTVRHNDPENFIDDPEYFQQYGRWLLLEHEGNNIQTSSTKVSNAKMHGG